MDRELIRGLEERLINVWPAVETFFMDGWVVRLANGYASRTNSATPLISGVGMTPGLLDDIERIYTAAGLPPAVRVTPVCDPAVEDLLLARGYHVKNRSRIMLLDLAGYRLPARDPRIHIDSAPTRRWIDGVSAHQSPEKRNADHLGQIVNRIRVPAAFAAIHVDDADVGFAMCAVDRGYAEIGSVIVAESQRARGLGRAVTDSLLAFGLAQGAHHAFLQVDATNPVAINLYSRQGFVDVGGYVNMVLDRKAA
jgi:N-acetylglutamate synthase